GIDNDCNGLLDGGGDPGLASPEEDNDGDGYVECSGWEGEVGAVIGGGDCNDNPSEGGDAEHPGHAETCPDGIDNNC
ncbi:MAG TPA: hypothetical protein DIU15_18935, partial [Deltaproteobacteria bacterium]|nr:hypothetical protein [Deltaproteobacteria bacterium]